MNTLRSKQIINSVNILTIVSNIIYSNKLVSAINTAKLGSVIKLKNGIWSDIRHLSFIT